MKKSIIYYTYKTNIKTNSLEKYVNFVDNKEKQIKYFNVLIILLLVVLSLFFVFCFIQL